MANTQSAAKRIRSNERKRARNQMVKSALRTGERRFSDAVASGDFETAESAQRALCSILDKAAKRRVIHANKADRKKSRSRIALDRAKSAAS